MDRIYKRPIDASRFQGGRVTIRGRHIVDGVRVRTSDGRIIETPIERAMMEEIGETGSRRFTEFRLPPTVAKAIDTRVRA